MATAFRIGRLGRWLLGALALLVLILGLCEALGWRFLRDPLQSRLSTALQREVRCGPTFRLHLLGSVRLQCSEILLGNPEGAPFLFDEQKQPRPLLHATGVRMAVPYASLLALRRGEGLETVEITSLTLEQLDANLAQSKDGRANFKFGPPKPPKPRGEEEPLLLPRFGELQLRQGRLRLEDAQHAVSVDGRLSTSEGSAGGANAGLRAEAEGRWQGKPLAMRLEAGGVLPLVGGDGSQLVPIKLHVEAAHTRIDLDGRVADVMSLRALQARFQVKGASLAGAGGFLSLTLPTTGPFQMAGTIAKKDERWHALVESFTVGSSRMRGEFDFDPTLKPPRLSGTLAGQRLALSDLAPALGAAAQGEGPAQSAPPAKRSRVLPQQEFDLPELGRMQADVRIDLDNAFLGTGALESFHPLQARVLLKDRVLTLQDLVARTAGGELRGQIGLDARSEQPQWQAGLRWSDVQLERFVKPRNVTAAEHRGEDKPAPGYVSGILGGQAQLRGVGRSTAAMLASLDGGLDLWVRNGALSHLVIEGLGLDVAQALGVLVKGDQRLPLNCAVVRVKVQDGLVRPEVAVFDTSDTTILASGEVSLAKESLNLTLAARPKDFSPLSLRSPVHVEGSFAEPEVSLERGKLALKLGAATALAFVNPLAAILPLMDPGEQDKAGCQQTLRKFSR
ncbi:AsmA family protein [uncultured Azohydromonas sp.]|uniref:AsmA family protein n=1 Tax=uncultured Azohydromonas sp. TaxID=487342 RepID=UPI0026358F4B|nr:AsmA family protein [uncultured Azohydromonas sp.]